MILTLLMKSMLLVQFLKLDGILFNSLYFFLTKTKHNRLLKSNSNHYGYDIPPRQYWKNVWDTLFLNIKVVLGKNIPYSIHNYRYYEGLIHSNLDKPVVVFSIHQGVIDLEQMILNNNTRKTYVLTANYHPYVNKWLNQKRQSNNSIMIQADEFGQNYRSILSENPVIAILIDQARTTQYQEYILNGKPIDFYTQILDLAWRKNWGIIPVNCYLGDDKHCHISFETPLDGKRMNSKEIHGAIQGHVENWISRNPQQWIWHYKRKIFG